MQLQLYLFVWLQLQEGSQLLVGGRQVEVQNEISEEQFSCSSNQIQQTVEQAPTAPEYNTALFRAPKRYVNPLKDLNGDVKKRKLGPGLFEKKSAEPVDFHFSLIMYDNIVILQADKFYFVKLAPITVDTCYEKNSKLTCRVIFYKFTVYSSSQHTYDIPQREPILYYTFYK